MPHKSRLTVLFCPLHWGLGHITRDMPLIRWFHNKGHRVVVAGSPEIQSWLSSEIPEIETTEFNNPGIRYSHGKTLFPKLLLQIPKLLLALAREKGKINQLVEKYHPDIIMSDNRYGARHPHIFSVIITHQLMLKLPPFFKWAEPITHKLIKTLIKPFDEVWIPDFSSESSLAGDLVHKFPLPRQARLIGPLSRFPFSSERSPSPKPKERKGILAIISGPEPQRSILEKKLIGLAPTLQNNLTLLRGTPDNGQEEKHYHPNPIIYSHLPSKALQEIIHASEIIIARSGYSTIMDMYYLQRSMWMVPTPGQTEQIYLAGYHQQKDHQQVDQENICSMLSQVPISQENNAMPAKPPIFPAILEQFIQEKFPLSKQKRRLSQE